MPVEFTFSATNNGTDDYDGDIWLCLREEDGDYLVEAAPVLIPAGETTECVVTYSLDEEGTYTFLLAYVDGTGEFVSDESQTATLVVAQAVTNDVVPVYGYWADSYSRSQFVIAEADLADMAGCDVSAMTFYSTTSSANWGNASFDVYLKQVQESTISSLKDWNTLDKVYSGNLSIVGNKMVITFAEPYYYEGGNLLVGIINRRLAAQPFVDTEVMDAIMSTTFGTELMEDNVAECRQRLYALFVTGYGYDSPKDHNKNLKRIIERNIVCTDMFEWDYDNWKPKVKPKQLSLL
jgi:hypothetical protein